MRAQRWATSYRERKHSDQAVTDHPPRGEVPTWEPRQFSLSSPCAVLQLRIGVGMAEPMGHYLFDVCEGGVYSGLRFYLDHN